VNSAGGARIAGFFQHNQIWQYQQWNDNENICIKTALRNVYGIAGRVKIARKR
jgi:hypothetical protein